MGAAMTSLLVIPEDGAGVLARHTDPTAVARELGRIGVEFERWPLVEGLPAAAELQAVLATHAAPLARLAKRYTFRSQDVVSMSPDHPDRAAVRQKFRREHTHADAEVRFFVAGRGVFYLHVGDRVLATLCGAGDFISVPVDMRHWFDMGSRPAFCSLRLFTAPDGWVGRFTGSDISERIPDFDALTAEAL
jgi:1,2-dihydroxy-3-keto-5-methylthiopentene dioxygenase